MYKGKNTYFYNGEKLYDFETSQYLVHDKEERLTWEVIMVLPGVEVIPDSTFSECWNVKTVIMSDTVRRIEGRAFDSCYCLEFVKLSTSLEYIGRWAFHFCRSLTSIFIPPSCREIGDWAFQYCKQLIIFNVPENTELGGSVIARTALIKSSPFQTNDRGEYANTNQVNGWIRNRHADNQFSLHRACASYNPLDEVIFNIVKREGIGAFKNPDSVGITPSQYLSLNPFTEIKEEKIIKRYILEMMGEVV